MRILVAEDDRATRARLLACLTEWGHDPLPAEDGAEAFEIFQREDVHLVLSDWQMPGLSGLDLLRKIRAKSAGGYSYVILLTSRSDTNDLVEAMEAGADDFVTKPFNLDELRVRLRAGERIVRLERELEAKNAVLTEANQRMASNLSEAAKVQKAFLPNTPPPSSSGVDSAWIYQPCEGLAGDMFNLIQLDERRVAVYMIDVSGHGVAAALLSVHVSRVLTQRGATLLRGEGDEPTPPTEVAAALNGRFAFDGAVQQYFTFLYGILDIETGEFRYTSAGHPGPILSRADRSEIQPPTPPAVGFIENAEFTQQLLELQPGDRILFYTDGIFEVEDRSNDLFGEEQLARTWSETRENPLQESLDGIVARVRDWASGAEPDDDVSLLALEFRGR